MKAPTLTELIRSANRNELVDIANGLMECGENHPDPMATAVLAVLVYARRHGHDSFMLDGKLWRFQVRSVEGGPL
jgi:hypothetical protein